MNNFSGKATPTLSAISFHSFTTRITFRRSDYFAAGQRQPACSDAFSSSWHFLLSERRKSKNRNSPDAIQIRAIIVKALKPNIYFGMGWQNCQN
jgi:hypothetical protein